MSDDEIFSAALELPTEASQRELVESLCSGDSEQFRRVCRLLQTHHRMQDSSSDRQSILDRAALVFKAFSDAEDLLPGKRVGRYVLIEIIGEGATSLVFRARQIEPVEQEVALKILKPGMDSQRILARFGLEYQVLQRLQHAGITPVFDVGLHENGRPFFAMELVADAKTLTTYAEHFKLDFRRRIQLMIATCEIVQHAHQRGVIHRDLKPSNILLTGVPEEVPRPRIIDFGIAKILQAGEDSSSVTTLGDRFGTPAYMSPEQALMPASAVDIRSDVYSLGVVFYELLTGLTPRAASSEVDDTLPWTSDAYWNYRTPSPSDLRKQTAEPPKGRNQQGSEKELDLIALKAIARDQQDRYQTVADFQRDLQRYLNGEAIEAAGPGFVYRAGKVIQRNPAISVAVCVTLLTIMLTSILTASFAFRAHEAEQRVRVQLDETLEAQKQLVIQRDRAESAMKKSQSLLRVFQVQSVTDCALARFLKHKLESAVRGDAEGRVQLSEDLTPLTIQVEVLSKPHPRLIVAGDWEWASSRFPADIINMSFQLTSRQAAESLPGYQDKTPGDSSPTGTAEVRDNDASVRLPSEQSLREASVDRTSFQGILLEELRAVLSHNDPFIAEALDNCGLQALDNNRPDEAERFLAESVRIWGTTGNFPANLVQSQLFHAEALGRLSDWNRSMATLVAAKKNLGKVPRSDSHFSALQDFCRQIELSIPENFQKDAVPHEGPRD